jgi:hypothetical protein
MRRIIIVAGFYFILLIQPYKVFAQYDLSEEWEKQYLLRKLIISLVN